MNDWSNTEPVNTHDSSPNKKIGGWLYLVAIGITLAPIANFFNLNMLIETAKNADWEFIWQQGPGTVLFLIYEYSMQGYMFVYSALLAILFYTKKHNFPKMFIIYVSSLLGLGVLGVFITENLPNSTPEQLVQPVVFVIYCLIVALIWVPYFLKSKRVKATFTKQ